MQRVISLPSGQTHIWTVSNRGDLLGDIVMTKNIDFDSNIGKVRLAERVAILQDGITDQTLWTTGQIQYPRAFARTAADGTDRFWAMVGGINYTGGGSPFWVTSGTDPTTGWAQDANSLPPTTAVDSLEVFLQSNSSDRLVCPDTNGDINMLNTGNAGTQAITAVNAASPIQITTATAHGLFTGNKVNISGTSTPADGNWTITKVDATNFTLNGSTGSGTASSGTITKYKWKCAWWTGNLGQSALTSLYPMILKKFDVNKLLLVCNGANVHTIDSTLAVSANRLVFPSNYYINCVVATPDYAWFFLNNLSTGDAIAARWNGGNQTYDTPIKLYDKNVFAATILDGIPYCVNGKGQLLKYNGQSFAEIDVLPVFYSRQRWSDGSADSTNSNTILHRNGMTVIDGKIHIFLKASMNGTVNSILENFSSGIWCYTPGTGLYCKYTVGQYRSTDLEWGSRIISAAGPLIETDLQHGRFLAGGMIFPTDSGSSADPVLLYSKGTSTANQRGQFITSQFHVPDLQTMYIHMKIVRSLWDAVSYSFERFVNATDMLIIKMRTNKDPLRTFQQLGPSAITWTSTTTFTSTSSVLANAVVGNEIEFSCGKGAGATAHISSISLNAGTYTVTLDEAIPNISNNDKGEAYLNNWIKISVTNVQTLEEKVSQIAKNSSFIQFKVEMRGTATSPELKDLTASYQPLAR